MDARPARGSSTCGRRPRSAAAPPRCAARACTDARGSRSRTASRRSRAARDRNRGRSSPAGRSPFRRPETRRAASSRAALPARGCAARCAARRRRRAARRATRRRERARHRRACAARGRCVDRRIAARSPRPADAIDVEVRERILVRRVVLVAAQPRLHQHVLVAERRQHPRRVRVDELRHPALELRAAAAPSGSARAFS